MFLVACLKRSLPGTVIIELRRPSTSTTTILETDHLTREIGGLRIVDEVTVAIPTGRVMVIVGPSGAGKSSFLRLLNRLDEPTGGTVRFEERDYKEIPPPELRRPRTYR